MSEHYVPILKGRMGEFRALELAPELRDRMTPLVDIPRVPVADRHKARLGLAALGWAWHRRQG